MPAMAMTHEEDPKDVLWAKFGRDTPQMVTKNQVLCAVYERPERTKSGLYLADNTRDEDKFQGKVAMIVQMGPRAFVDSGDWVFDWKPEVGDWVWFRTADSFSITVNGKLCRVLDDDKIGGPVSSPDMVW